MVLGSIQRIWKPAVYHGRRSRQFEGWYYKLIDKNAHNTFAIIPGVIYNSYNGLNPYQRSHAFIQIFNGNTGDYKYFRFELDRFNAASKNFMIHIGENEFSTDRIILKIDESETVIQGEVHFTDMNPWPVRFLTPGAMGPLAFLPRLECFHAIISFDHLIHGGFSINGTKYDFEGGKGFIGKEWGSNHPSSWIWIQSNHFEEDQTSLNVSIARVPYLLWNFPGFAIGFLHQGKLHRFTTYNRSKITELSVKTKQVSVTASNRNYRLEVTAHQGEGTMLKSPEREGMLGEVFESLLSKVYVKFYKLQKGRSTLLFEGTGYPTGMEIKGDMAELRAE